MQKVQQDYGCQRLNRQGYPLVCHCGNHSKDHERLMAFWDLIARAEPYRKEEDENKDKSLLAK